MSISSLFENVNLKDNRISLEIAKDRQIDKLACKVFCTNEIEGLCQMSIYNMNNSCIISIDKTHKKSLYNQLKDREIKVERLIGVIERVFEIVENAESYFMKSNNFLFNYEYIFIDNSKNVSLVYLPVEEDVYEDFGIKEFIKKIFIACNISDEDKEFVHEEFLRSIKTESNFKSYFNVLRKYFLNKIIKGQLDKSGGKFIARINRIGFSKRLLLD